MSNIKLSILIPTINGREGFYNSLMHSLTFQIMEYGFENEIEVLTNKDNSIKAIGAKRNELIAAATGEYVCFIDDDDKVSDHYITRVMHGCYTGADCVSLKGNYYLDNVFYKPFIHSIKYKEWNNDNPEFYERCPNHLNAIKREHVKDILFDEVNFGEDGKWSYALRDSGRLKTEYEIDEVIYHYYHRSSK